MTPVLQFAIKDLRLLSRDRIRLFLTAAWPLLIAIFFGAFGLDFRPSSRSMRFSVAIIAPASIETTEANSLDDKDQPSSIRQALAQILDESGRFDPHILALDDAHSSLRDDHYFAVLTVDESISDQPVTIDLNYAPSHEAEAKQLSQLLSCPIGSISANEAGHPRFVLRSLQPYAETAEGFSVRRPLNTYSVTFPQGILWAVMSCAATFAVSILSERNRGTLDRLRAFPLSFAEILAGKALACLLCIFTMEFILLTIGVLFFAVRPTSWIMLVVALFCVAIAFVGMMMLIAVIGRNSESSNGLAWAVLMVMAMIGGAMLPIFLMPDWMIVVANLSPVAWSLIAIEGALWRQHSWPEQVLPCSALLVLGWIAWSAGVRLFSRS